MSTDPVIPRVDGLTETAPGHFSTPVNQQHRHPKALLRLSSHLYQMQNEHLFFFWGFVFIVLLATKVTNSSAEFAEPSDLEFFSLYAETILFGPEV
jgi:hypothetical protein